MAAFQKIISFFLALLNIIFLNTGIRKVDITEAVKNGGTQLVGDGQSNLSATAAYALGAKNSAQGIYTDPSRTAYRMTNANAALTHKLKGAAKTATLTDRDGGVYVDSSFRSFCADETGIRTYFENSAKPGRVNTIRLGVYYYECHVRDLETLRFKVDKAFHVYADRLYMQYSILAKKPTNALKEFGSEITIPRESVEKLLIKDRNGTRSTLSGTDETTVEYVAFDIRDTGVVGFIVPSDGSTEKLTVSLGVNGYTVRQYAAFDRDAGLNDYLEEGGKGLNKVTFGCRIYTDKTHSFEGIDRAAYEERNPLEGITVSSGSSGAVYNGYDALRGAYTLTMNGTDFQTAYDHPDLRYTAPITITGADSDRVLYFRAYATSGCLEAAALLDDADTLVPMDVEVCKNFCGDGGEGFYSAKDPLYGDAFFPICVKKDEPIGFTLIDLYQNWGKYPIKQLSSIEFHTSYYHLSTGTTESNCIAPYFVGDKDGWTLPDFRNRSGKIWSGQPQFNSVGILKFMTYRDGITDKTYYSEFAGSRIDSCGLTHSDVTNTYVDDGGNYTYTVRHVEFPQTDENRTYYSLRVKFDRKVTYEDFRSNFDLFYFDGRFVKFNKAAYLNENDLPTVTNVDTSDRVRYYKLGSDHPYLGFYDVTDDTEYQIDNCFGCNFALIVRDSRITVRGGEKKIPFVFKEDSAEDITRCALTLDTDKITFNKGDTIEIDMVLLPWGTGRETGGATILKVREDSAKKPLTVTAKTGTVMNDTLIPTVLAEGGEAEFTVTGGRNNNTVAVRGLPSLRAPRIQKLVNGEWQNYNTASSFGYDGYSVRLAEDGTYTFSFVFDTDSPDQINTFRVNALRE